MSVKKRSLDFQVPKAHLPSPWVSIKHMSFTVFCSCPRESSINQHSLFVLLHAFFVLPLLLFLWGVHFSAFFGDELTVIWSTCLSYRQRHSSIIEVNGFISISASSKVLLLLVSGQNMPLNLHKRLVWKGFSLLSISMRIVTGKNDAPQLPQQLASTFFESF